MLTVPQVAKIWNQVGVSTIPILTNGTKRPAVQWGIYQTELPSFGVMDEWWANGHSYGLALIMGSVSGNLEMLELEGRATDEDTFSLITAELDRLGVYEEWTRLWESGYVEQSPSGGIHLIYRIEGNPVPGNEKVARRPATPEELADNPQDKVKVLAETRGEGGYVIVAPTSGLCHPSGKAWHKLDGEFGQVATITWEVRQAIHAAIRTALDDMPLPVPAPAAPTASPVSLSGSGAGLRPGEDWASRTQWRDILEPAGWTYDGRKGYEEFWVRPGKSRRDGHSATTNYGGADTLKIFSTSVDGFEAEATYSKFGAFAQIHHGGDFKAATQELVRLGYGEQRPITAQIEIANWDDRQPEVQTETSTKFYECGDTGNTQRLWDQVRGRFHYVHEEKGYRRWNGKAWEDDFDGALEREAITATYAMDREAKESGSEDLTKWAKRSRDRKGLNAVQEGMRKMLGCTKRAISFDADLHLLNLGNGTLNLKTGELGPHDSRNLITRVFAADYDSNATCPNFTKFMEDVLPDERMRSYVQRCLGYGLLGEADQRSLFIIHGPSGTGKSTLMDTMRHLFGDYGISAGAGTFKQHLGGGPNNDLHGLRGKRFVTSSETSESASFNEDEIKRLTGRDQVTSRELYQKNQEWTPECVIWLATNHAPKFTSDDDAIWRRVKLVPFNTQFQGEREIPDLSRRKLIPEANGILNWLLEGLASYLEYGLDQPPEVAEAAADLRSQSDSVTRFLEDRIADGVLVQEPGQTIRTVELHRMYQEWVRESGEKPLGTRRFTNRLLSSAAHLGHSKVGGQTYWVGVGRTSGAGILGTMAPPDWTRSQD